MHQCVGEIPGFRAGEQGGRECRLSKIGISDVSREGEHLWGQQWRGEDEGDNSSAPSHC